MPDNNQPPAPGAAPQPGAGVSTTPEKIFDGNAAGGSTPPSPDPKAATPPASPPSGSEPPKGDDKGAEGKTVESANEAARIVPEKYDLKLPDGSLLDSKATERTATFAKENGLTNKEAQAVLERENQAVASYVDAQKEMLAQKQKEWVESVKTDKEVGGETFTRNTELAKRVVDRYGSEAFKKALIDSGLGNHPELFRFVARIGHAMSEDQLIMPGTQPSQPKSLEDVFYPQSAGKS